MKFIKNFILILLFIFPISNSFGAMVTHNQTATVSMSSGGIVAGVEFNMMELKCLHLLPKRMDQLIILKNIIYLNLMISPQEFLQEIASDVS